jgi:hypothetical protein
LFFTTNLTNKSAASGGVDKKSQHRQEPRFIPLYAGYSEIALAISASDELLLRYLMENLHVPSYFMEFEG